MSAKFTVATVAGCEPGYVQEALGHVGTFVGELKDQAGCVGARYGVISTGAYTGSLVLLQSYASMSDIEKMFGVYAASPAYQSVINSGRVSVTFRNIMRLEDVRIAEQAEAPAYGVVTLAGATPGVAELVRKVAPVFETNGAMVLRHGVLATGSNAGKHVLAVGYPSMDAIEKTYVALRAHADYAAAIGGMNVISRDIFRVAG